MGHYECDGCGLSDARKAETLLVAGKFRFCSACLPVCCVCRRSCGDDDAARDEWRVNGFRINNRQFICGRCRWRPKQQTPEG